MYDLRHDELTKIRELGDVEKVTTTADHVRVYARFSWGNNAYLFNRLQNMNEFEVVGVCFNDGYFEIRNRR